MSSKNKTYKSLPDTIAAIDLGSNSFHMIITKRKDDSVVVIDQLKETIRLGAGLDDKNQITDEAMERVLTCLARFGERIKHIPSNGVRIVGTNTLRRASNSSEILNKAETLLGHSIEIVSGIEEARLIYLGVAHHVVKDNGRRMVIDIGGGSTEIILGDRFEPIYIRSFEMGSAVISDTVFSNGKISPKRIRLAQLKAEAELEPYAEQYKKLNWQDVIGASGSIKSIQKVVSGMGWCSNGISADSLEKIIKKLLQISHVNELDLKGLKPDRQPVFAGGVMVLKAIFDTFNIEHMSVSQGALREGIIYDLIDREKHQDTRSTSIQEWMDRYAIDKTHAQAVTNTALDLFSQVETTWQIDEIEYQRNLCWATNIHEIGLSISHTQSHKHAEYIIRNADLLGFSQDDQQILAVLVRSQRGSFSTELFKSLKSAKKNKLKKIAIILRISILLTRSRNYKKLIMPTMTAKNKKISLTFSDNYLEQNPLTNLDLSKEQETLAKAGYLLDIN